MFATNHIMLTFGSDFQYQDARLNFDNMDKLIKYTMMKVTSHVVFISCLLMILVVMLVCCLGGRRGRGGRGGDHIVPLFIDFFPGNFQDGEFNLLCSDNSLSLSLHIYVYIYIERERE